jgi:hypothetical protein
LGYQIQGTEFHWPIGLFHRPRRLLLEKSLAGRVSLV